MSSASISYDTANPLMPFSNRIGELVSVEPCTVALATPLKRTLTSLHQYLHATDPAKKTKLEADYASESTRLMTNLRTCLENLKNTSKDKFDGLMNFFRAFGEKLPKFINFLKTPEATPDLEFREAQAQAYEHVLSSIIKFGREKKDFPNSITLDFQYAKTYDGNNQATFEVRNPKLLFHYLDLASKRNTLVNNSTDHNIKMYFFLAQAIKQKLENPNEALSYSSIQDCFSTSSSQLVSKNINDASAYWEKRHQNSTFTGIAYQKISTEQAAVITSKLKDKFPRDRIIHRPELLPTYVNLSNRLEAILPSAHTNETSRLEHLLQWYLNFDNFDTKRAFLESIGLQERALAQVVHFWNGHFEK